MPADDDAATPAVVLTARLTPLEVEAVRTAAEARAALRGAPFVFAPVQVVPAPPEE